MNKVVSIIGPHYFEDGGAVIVNANRCANMIGEFFQPAPQERALENFKFQQDGATAHTTQISIKILRQMCPGLMNSRGRDIAWLTRSPDLTPKEPAGPEASNTRRSPTHHSSILQTFLTLSTGVVEKVKSAF